jgi:glutamate synthase domain-containing protein 3
MKKNIILALFIISTFNACSTKEVKKDTKVAWENTKHYVKETGYKAEDTTLDAWDSTKEWFSDVWDEMKKPFTDEN